MCSIKNEELNCLKEDYKKECQFLKILRNVWMKTQDNKNITLRNLIFEQREKVNALFKKIKELN